MFSNSCFEDSHHENSYQNRRLLFSESSQKSGDELFIRARIDLWILGSLLSILSQFILVIYESILAHRIYRLRDERNFGQSLIHSFLTKCCLLCLAYLAYTVSIVSQAWNNIFHHFAWLLGSAMQLTLLIIFLSVFTRVLQKITKMSDSFDGKMNGSPG